MDESLIHAYLDGELDPESRSAVEEEARADAGLARRIGELARLSGLLANLHRPPDPPDLSGAVVSRIRREEARRRARQPIAAATVLALAALLMITLFRDGPAPRGDDPRLVGPNQGPAVGPGPAGAREARATDREPRVAEAEPEGEPGPPGPGAPALWSSIALADLDPSGPLSDEEAEARAFLIDLVDRRTSRAIEIEAASGISAEAVADALDGILLDFARDDPRYGRIAESGLIGRPGALFVLLAGDLERDRLRTRIAEELGDRCRILDPPGLGADPDAGIGNGEAPGNPGPPILLAGTGSLVLKEAEQYAPLRAGPVDQTDRYDATRHHPHDADLIMPEVGVLPPMPDRLPTFPTVHPSPPPPGPGPASGQEPDAPGPPAEVILLRVSQAG